MILRRGQESGLRWCANLHYWTKRGSFFSALFPWPDSYHGDAPGVTAGDHLKKTAKRIDRRGPTWFFPAGKISAAIRPSRNARTMPR